MTPSIPVEVTFSLPGWLAGVNGTVGVKDFNTDVEAGFDDIISNLDMIAAGTLEVRKGKLGFVFDGMYLKASVSGDSPGPLLSNVDVSIEQVLAEGAFLYRIYEGDRLWIDFLAGARYFYLSNSLNLTVDSAGVRSASEELSARIVERAVEAARDEVEHQLPTILADLRDQVTASVQNQVSERVDEIRGAIGDRIDQGLGGSGPAIGGEIVGNGRIRDAIREYAHAAAVARVESARAQASAAMASARARIRKEAEKRLTKAEANLSKTLEREITRRIPTQELAASRDWVDPFVGVRARCQIGEDWYAIFRGDIGGFGLNSDQTINLFGALGLKLTERSSVEVGYRYLSVDYQSGGFTYDMVTQGPYIGLGVTF
ncbi:MAG: hypothetical protein KDN20_04050 [Verrucomicrobiae bacterium]|nr:hypothetical protein [Verrucomicrobiae bacterium]